MITIRTLATIALCLTLLHSGPSYSGSVPTGCSVNNVKLKNLTSSYDSSYSKVTGVLSHSCTVAIGIELKWSGFYSDKTVAFSEEFWPNSISNIPPNVDFPFEYMVSDRIAPSIYTMVVNSVRAWGAE
jgi:hypothetical protein